MPFPMPDFVQEFSVQTSNYRLSMARTQQAFILSAGNRFA
jgi:hypothetical protein